MDGWIDGHKFRVVSKGPERMRKRDQSSHLLFTHESRHNTKLAVLTRVDWKYGMPDQNKNNCDFNQGQLKLSTFFNGIGTKDSEQVNEDEFSHVCTLTLHFNVSPLPTFHKRRCCLGTIFL